MLSTIYKKFIDNTLNTLNEQNTKYGQNSSNGLLIEISRGTWYYFVLFHHFPTSHPPLRTSIFVVWYTSSTFHICGEPDILALFMDSLLNKWFIFAVRSFLSKQHCILLHNFYLTSVMSVTSNIVVLSSGLVRPLVFAVVFRSFISNVHSFCCLSNTVIKYMFPVAKVRFEPFQGSSSNAIISTIACDYFNFVHTNLVIT